MHLFNPFIWKMPNIFSAMIFQFEFLFRYIGLSQQARLCWYNRAHRQIESESEASECICKFHYFCTAKNARNALCLFLFTVIK